MRKQIWDWIYSWQRHGEQKNRASLENLSRERFSTLVCFSFICRTFSKWRPGTTHGSQGWSASASDALRTENPQRRSVEWCREGFRCCTFVLRIWGSFIYRGRLNLCDFSTSISPSVRWVTSTYLLWLWGYEIIMWTANWKANWQNYSRSYRSSIDQRLIYKPFKWILNIYLKR